MRRSSDDDNPRYAGDDPQEQTPEGAESPPPDEPTPSNGDLSYPSGPPGPDDTVEESPD